MGDFNIYLLKSDTNINIDKLSKNQV